MNNEQLDKAVAYNAKEFRESDFSEDQVVRLVEFWQNHHDLTADGLAGAMTQKSIDDSISCLWDLDLPTDPIGDDQFVDGEWLHWNGPENSQPTKGEQIAYFGNPETFRGSNFMSQVWYRGHIVECHQSNGNRLPGIPAKWYIKVHRMVEPYLREALRRATVICPNYPIERMGSYNFRHIGGDPNRSLSMHSFGVAFDVNPSANSGMHYAKGNAPKAYDARYMKRWPNGVPQAFVQSFTSCGFAWGSDWDEDGETHDHTFLDPMHFEWVARDGINTKV